jgi:hypothetical protein
MLERPGLTSPASTTKRAPTAPERRAVGARRARRDRSRGVSLLERLFAVTEETLDCPEVLVADQDAGTGSIL